MSTGTEKMQSTEVLYRGRILTLRKDVVQVSNGKTAVREVVEHNGGVTVAALTVQNELLMVRQLRYPYNEVLLELPAGKREGDEDPLTCGVRELREETGAIGRDYRSRGCLYPTPGYSNEIIWMFLCRVEQIGNTAFDEDEMIEVARVPLEQAVQMVMNNKIPDAKTQIAVLKTAELVRNGAY